MGDLYARVLEPSTLKCAPVKSSNHISLPWRGYARLTRTHTYSHTHKNIGRRSLDGDESLRSVFFGLWHPPAHFRSCCQGSTRVITLWRWKRPTLLSVGCKRGRMWPSSLGRTQTQSVRALVKRAKTKEDRTKQTSGCSCGSCEPQRHIMKEVMATVDPFWPARLCSLCTNTNEKCTEVHDWYYWPRWLTPLKIHFETQLLENFCF